jgi:hypothetical protein
MNSVTRRCGPTSLRARLLAGATQLASVNMSGNFVSGNNYLAVPAIFNNPTPGTADTLVVETTTGVLLVEYTLTPIVTTGATLQVTFTDNVWLSYERPIEYTTFVLSQAVTVPSDHADQYIEDFRGGEIFLPFNKFSTGALESLDLRSQYYKLINQQGFNYHTEDIFSFPNISEASVVLPFSIQDTGTLTALAVPIITSGILTETYEALVAPIIQVDRDGDNAVVSLLNPIQGYQLRLYFSTSQSRVFNKYTRLGTFELNLFPLSLANLFNTANINNNYKFKAVYVVPQSPTTTSGESQPRIARGYNI